MPSPRLLRNALGIPVLRRLRCAPRKVEYGVYSNRQLEAPEGFNLGAGAFKSGSGVSNEGRHGTPAGSEGRGIDASLLKWFTSQVRN